jgi:hypothetical protein
MDVIVHFADASAGLTRSLRVKRLGDSKAVFVDMVPGDKAVLDGEVQSETGAIGTPGGAGGLTDLAEHDRVATVDEDALDLGRCLPRHMVLGELAVVGGSIGAGETATDPWGSSPTVLGLRPGQLPVGPLGIHLSDVLGIALTDPPQQFLHGSTSGHGYGYGHDSSLRSEVHVRLTRLDQHSGQRRQIGTITSQVAARSVKIIEAAASLIPEVGWGGVSSRRVAERAGVNTGVIHYRVGSIGELRRIAAVRKIRTFFLDRIREALAETAPAAAVETMLRVLSAGDPRDPELLLLYESLVAASRDDQLRVARPLPVAVTRLVI